MGRIRPLALLALALALTIAFASCGGGDEEGGEATRSAEATAAEQSGQPNGVTTKGGEAEAGQGSGASSEGGGEVQEGAIHAERPLIIDTSSLPEPTAGSKRAAPGVPTSKGGDNSIQLWGVEATAEQRERVTRMVQDFQRARAATLWGKACTYLAVEARAEFERLARNPNAACAQGMRALAAGVPATAFAEQANIADVLSLRVGERYAFLIYTRGDGLLYAMGFQREGGEWKIVNASPNQFERVGG